MPRVTKKQKEAGLAPKPKARSSAHPTSAPGGRGRGIGRGGPAARGSSRGRGAFGGRGGLSGRGGPSDRGGSSGRGGPPGRGGSSGRGGSAARGGGAERGGSAGRGGAGRGGSAAATGAKRGGFNVKPPRAPKDAYLGKAQKIKADLIQRAKMKQQYAKVLREEGMSSGRLGDGTRRRNERDPGAVPGAGAGAGDDGSDGEGDESEVDSDSSEEGIRGALEKGKGKGTRREMEERRLEARAGPAPGSGFGSGSRPRTSERPNRHDTDRPPNRENGRPPYSRERPPHQPKVRALSLSPPPPPAASVTEATGAGEAPKTSFRSLKKEAFSKFHRPRESTVASGGRGRGPRGQPNMGARMGALLEKIKMDVRR